MVHFDKRTEELIALGSSIAANCYSCLEYHVAAARENGIQEEEIKAAIEVGRMVRKGAAHKLDQLAASIGRKQPEEVSNPLPCCGSNS